MAKSISVYRRKPDLVDLWVNTIPGAASYDFKRATNFDAAFSSFQVVPATGFASVSARNNAGFEASQFRGKTRFRFAMSDYTFPDDEPLWIRYAITDTAGVTAPDEAIHVIFPVMQARQPFVLVGEAPNEASLDDSLEINLQMQCGNFTVRNAGDGGDPDVLVSLTPGGPEFTVGPVPDEGPLSLYPTSSQIFIRGDSATVDFEITCTVRNEIF